MRCLSTPAMPTCSSANSKDRSILRNRSPSFCARPERQAKPLAEPGLTAFLQLLQSSFVVCRLALQVGRNIAQDDFPVCDGICLVPHSAIAARQSQRSPEFVVRVLLLVEGKDFHRLILFAAAQQAHGIDVDL